MAAVTFEVSGVSVVVRFSEGELVVKGWVVSALKVVSVLKVENEDVPVVKGTLVAARLLQKVALRLNLKLKKA